MWQEGWSSKGSGWSLCEKGKLWGDVAGRMFHSFLRYLSTQQFELFDKYSHRLCHLLLQLLEGYGSKLPHKFSTSHLQRQSKQSRRNCQMMFNSSVTQQEDTTHNQFIDFLFFSGSPKSTQLLVRKNIHHHRPKQLFGINIVQQSSSEACYEMDPPRWCQKVPLGFRRKGWQEGREAGRPKRDQAEKRCEKVDTA